MCKVRQVSILLPRVGKLWSKRNLLVDKGKTVRERGEVTLDLCLLLLFLEDLAIDLLALLAKILNALHQLIVIVLVPIKSSRERHKGVSALFQGNYLIFRHLYTNIASKSFNYPYLHGSTARRHLYLVFYFN